MLNYSIESSGDRYILTVWEPAQLTTNRVKPFVFKATYTLGSHLEAFGILKLIQGVGGTARTSHRIQPEFKEASRTA